MKKPKSYMHEPPSELSTKIITLLLALVSGINALFMSLTAIFDRDWATILPAIISLLVTLVSIVATYFAFRHNRHLAIYISLGVLFTGLLSQVLVRKGLGLPFSIVAVVIISILGFLSLPKKQFGNIFLLGIGLGLSIILTDLFLPQTRYPAASIITIIAYSIAGISALVFIYIFVRQYNFLGLTTKILIGSILITLIPVILIGSITARSMRNTVTASAEENLHNSAAQTAKDIDTFIQNNLDSVRTDSQSPALMNFADTTRNSSSTTDPGLYDNASATIRSLSRRDLLLVESYAIINLQGINVLDTESASLGKSELGFEYITQPLQTGLPYASSIYYDEDNDAYLVFSSPIRNQSGDVVGVLRLKYNAAILQQLVSHQSGLAGNASYAILIDENDIILADGYSMGRTYKTLSPISVDRLSELQLVHKLPPCDVVACSNDLTDLQRQILTGNGYINFHSPDPDGDSKASEAWIASLDNQSWRVIYIQSSEVLQAPLVRQTRLIAILAALVILFSTWAGIIFARQIVNPIQNMISISDQISQGNFELRTEIKNGDEIGSLARTINSMTDRLRETIETLETRVAERTLNIERRTLLMHTAADVGRTASSTRELSSLLNEAVYLISERFGFFHTGIFLQDDRGEFAILKAANSAGGQRMLERGHRLRIGHTGIVGYAIAQKKARIALDVGDDAAFFDNPDLPETRSEMALPLLSGETVLGAIDVQSTKTNAFGEEDIAALQIMADQIAIAIENARLLEEGREAVEAARLAYRNVEFEGWRRLLQKKVDFGFVTSQTGKVNPVIEGRSPEYDESIRSGKPVLADDDHVLFLPIHAQMNVIGVLRLEKEISTAWTDSDISLVSNISDQIGLALESARLFEETNIRAEREQLVSEITTKIRGESDPQAMLDTAIESLKQILGAKNIHIHPYVPSSVDGSKQESIK